jgi:capsular polysaccharide export protein
MLPRVKRLDVLAYGVMRVPHLRAFLPEADRISLRLRSDGGTEAIGGWGYRPTADRARRMAAKLGVPYWALEDGFFRSVGLGSEGAAPISLVADDRGIYFDATKPSRMEAMLNAPEPFPESELRRARDLIALKNSHDLSKYNAAPPFDASMLPASKGRERVLIVDQTAGDASIEHGLAAPESFERMVEAAIASHPGAQVIVKRHPAVASGYRRGLIDLARHGDPLVAMDEPVNPVQLLRQVDQVYTVSSLMGFEALLLGLPVHCFGMPFYAGWGATVDHVICERRSRKRSVEEIAAAALLRYPRYVDPLTGKPCEAEQAVERLITFAQRADGNRGHWSLAGIAFWKRAPLRQHLGGPTSTVSFHRTLERAIRRGGRPALWSAREREEDATLMRREKVTRIEDGFVRSAGLGSDFHGAASIALDDSGIYYDPASGSRLERILAEHSYPPELLERAAKLRAMLVRAQVTKYNLGAVDTAIDLPRDRPRLLVVGQVEGDASILRGGGHIQTNSALVEAVRAANPEAALLYKEHPDVLAGNRRGKLSAAASGLIAGRADQVSVDAALASVDEVHTLTSLAGFEALLRGKPVTTYGQPFFAGWGLSHDLHPPAHRTRKLTLDMLVAGALLLYPRYIDPVSGLPCEAEFVVQRLAEQRARGAAVETDGIWALARYARAVRYGLYPPRRARTY